MKVLVVCKRSVLQRYSRSKDEKVKQFALNDPKINSMHQNEEKSIQTVLKKLDDLKIEYERMYRDELKEVKNVDLVITIGGDGTFLDVSHFIKDNTPILGINSNPKVSVGFFCVAVANNFFDYLNGDKTELNRLKLTLNGKELPVFILNDLLIAHSNPAATTLYQLDVDGVMKNYKSSGLLISTAAGSSAWAYQEGGKLLPLNSKEFIYKSRGLRNETVFLAKKLKIKSLTREGKIFIDGTHLDYEFSLGDELVVENGLPIIVVGDLEKQRVNFK